MLLAKVSPGGFDAQPGSQPSRAAPAVELRMVFSTMMWPAPDAPWNAIDALKMPAPAQDRSESDAQRCPVTRLTQSVSLAWLGRFHSINSVRE